jgi:hypothetical protein
MGILAKERVLFVLIFFGLVPCGQAREDLFNLSTVDYFGMKLCKSESFARSSIWIDPGSGYRPPQVVMDLLNDPNEQTALEYLRWHRERLKKIARAQQVLEKVSAQSYVEAPE